MLINVESERDASEALRAVRSWARDPRCVRQGGDADELRDLLDEVIACLERRGWLGEEPTDDERLRPRHHV